MARDSSECRATPILHGLGEWPIFVIPDQLRSKMVRVARHIAIRRRDHKGEAVCFRQNAYRASKRYSPCRDPETFVRQCRDPRHARPALQKQARNWPFRNLLCDRRLRIMHIRQSPFPPTGPREAISNRNAV